MKQPDIYIILTEDICPNLGCYGDKNARTPNLDAFAKENIMFDYCSSAAPVCSAARTSLNLGMYGSTAGVGQHRSYKGLPQEVKNIGEYMQEAGYYTAIGKTDFNFPLNGGYDHMLNSTRIDSTAFAEELGELAKTTKKPLFVLHSILCTHQSQYGYTQDRDEHRSTMPRLKPEEFADRDAMNIPGYHFDTFEAREIWGQYHEKVTTMDRLFGEAIKALKEAGKYENSIIMFAGDNGHGIPMGKCELWNEGVHVPFLMHIPKELPHNLTLKKDKYGTVHCERLTSFIDFATTALSLAGAKAPEHLQGEILVGENSTQEPKFMYSFSERVDEVFENSRCMRSRQYLYSCDFAYSPTRRQNYYQTTQSPWFGLSMKQKVLENNIVDTDRRAFFKGMPRISEQLFDLYVDPNQLNNIAQTNKELKVEMRKAMLEKIVLWHDDAFMPEPICHQIHMQTKLTPYEILRDEKYYPVKELTELWQALIEGSCNINTHENPCAKMMLIWYFNKNNLPEKIKIFTDDENETVKAYACYCLSDGNKLANICKTTKNYILLLYISDLIATWDKQKGIVCLEAINQNCAVESKYQIGERYDAAMQSALQMLSYRFEHELAKSDWFNNSSEYVAKILDVTLA